jgi:hypothetical protein
MTATKRRGRILNTDAQLAIAERAAGKREQGATKIRAVRYDPQADLVSVTLSTGATLSVPRSDIPGFAHARPADLSTIAILPGAEAIWADSVDDGALLEQILEAAAGPDLLKVLGGRISGRQRSAEKAAASRENGKHGGRPPLTMTAFVAELDRALHEISPAAPVADTTHNSNPQFPASAYWTIGPRRLLYVKLHGAREVQVRAKWPRRRSIERRIRATAMHLARELADHLVA